MKKTIVFLIACFISTITFAQNEKYTAMMEKSIAQMGTAKTPEDLQKVANVFERIANAEKKEWLPAYYNALCHVNLAGLASEKGESDKIEALVNKAQKSLDHCMALAPEESEVLTLQGYVYISRIWMNPMINGAKYSPMANESFAKAIALNKENPRAYYLRGQLVFYTPEFWGGGAKNAHGDLAAASKLYEKFEKASSIHPDWGSEGNAYHLSQSEAALEDK